MSEAATPLPKLQDLPRKHSARYATDEARVLGEAWDPVSRTARVDGLTDISRSPEAQLFLDSKPLGVPIVGVYEGEGGYWIAAKDDHDRIVFPRRNLAW
ncbi:MAG: hypothetical protein IPO88_02260 [Nannocystis sp.]|uniref:hypothetical protein n=1 Tax=Nannocystis sp. TaxID=1962667 RepID=UPI0024240DD9|nr:hypothetical protein [Nannocystis sp.]MBK9752326.1 hypothetical protein [Nannocystis sp.]